MRHKEMPSTEEVMRKLRTEGWRRLFAEEKKVIGRDFGAFCAGFGVPDVMHDCFHTEPGKIKIITMPKKPTQLQLAGVAGVKDVDHVSPRCSPEHMQSRVNGTPVYARHVGANTDGFSIDVLRRSLPGFLWVYAHENIHHTCALPRFIEEPLCVRLQFDFAERYLWSHGIEDTLSEQNRQQRRCKGAIVASGIERLRTASVSRRQRIFDDTAEGLNAVTAQHPYVSGQLEADAFLGLGMLFVNEGFFNEEGMYSGLYPVIDTLVTGRTPEEVFAVIADAPAAVADQVAYLCDLAGMAMPPTYRLCEHSIFIGSPSEAEYVPKVARNERRT